MDILVCSWDNGSQKVVKIAKHGVPAFGTGQVGSWVGLCLLLMLMMRECILGI